MSQTEEVNPEAERRDTKPVVTTAAEYAQMQRVDAFQRLEGGAVVTFPLPSGARVRLRQPSTTAAFLLLRLHNNCYVAFGEERDQNKSLPDTEKAYAAAIAYIDFKDSMLAKIFVEPSYGSKPGQISDLITSDFGMILRWLGGEVQLEPDGTLTDLKEFSARQAVSAAPGDGGPQQPLPS